MGSIAAVFVRRTGADGAGHVGWAFACHDKIFCAGSVENPRHTLQTRPEHMGFWAVRTHDPIAPMRERAYNEFKVLDLDRGNSIYAWQVVAWVSRKPYDIFGRNCMDITYDVLRAFGVPHLPAPAHHWEPNHWFNHVQGRRYRIDAADVALEADAQGHSSVDLELPDLDSVLSGPPQGIEPAEPRWRTPNTPEWLGLHAAMAAAPPLPATSVRDTQAARHRIITKICRLFGVGLRD